MISILFVWTRQIQPWNKCHTKWIRKIWALLSIISFIDSLQFPSSSLDSLVKNLNQEFDFKYLSREYDNNVLDLVKKKVFYLYEYITDF